jgi:hypothetical protein
MQKQKAMWAKSHHFQGRLSRANVNLPLCEAKEGKHGGRDVTFNPEAFSTKRSGAERS